MKARPAMARPPKTRAAPASPAPSRRLHFKQPDVTRWQFDAIWGSLAFELKNSKCSIILSLDSLFLSPSLSESFLPKSVFLCVCELPWHTDHQFQKRRCLVHGPWRDFHLNNMLKRQWASSLRQAAGSWNRKRIQECSCGKQWGCE